jgi:hypothetical protein
MPGTYRYRLAAWSVHGRSPWAVSGDCQVSASADGGACALGVCESGSAPHDEQQKRQRHRSHHPSKPAQGQTAAPFIEADGDAAAANSAAGAALLTANFARAAAPHGHSGAPAAPAPPAPSTFAATAFAHVGRWLWALANSLLLIVIPLCVRLLPLPLLARVQRALLSCVLRALGRPAGGARPAAAAAAGLGSNAAPGEAAPLAARRVEELRSPPFSPTAAAVAAAAAAAGGAPIVGFTAAGVETHAPETGALLGSPESPHGAARRLLLLGGGGGSGRLARSGSDSHLPGMTGRVLSWQDMSLASAYASALEQESAANQSGGPGAAPPTRPAGAAAAASGPGGGRRSFNAGGEPLSPAAADGLNQQQQQQQQPQWIDEDDEEDGDFVMPARAAAAASATARIDKKCCAVPG